MVYIGTVYNIKLIEQLGARVLSNGGDNGSPSFFLPQYNIAVILISTNLDR